MWKGDCLSLDLSICLLMYKCLYENMCAGTCFEISSFTLNPKTVLRCRGSGFYAPFAVVESRCREVSGDEDPLYAHYFGTEGHG